MPGNRRSIRLGSYEYSQEGAYYVTVCAGDRKCLFGVVHRFKTMTTKQYCDGVKSKNWPTFNSRLWQRNFYEHVIRGESDLDRIREYIINNPSRWEDDEYYSMH